ncbi:hypothetical protein KEM54_002578, partial [Ascosphaera aggregata]
MSGPSTKSYNCATEPVPTSAPSAAHRACQTTSQTLMHKTNVGAKTSMTISSGSARSCSRDPSRPRRKKAKRACYACQRAHLTCGMSYLMGSYLLHRRRTDVLNRYSQVTNDHVNAVSNVASRINAMMACERKRSIFTMLLMK